MYILNVSSFGEKDHTKYQLTAFVYLNWRMACIKYFVEFYLHTNHLASVDSSSTRTDHLWYFVFLFFLYAHFFKISDSIFVRCRAIIICYLSLSFSRPLHHIHKYTENFFFHMLFRSGVIEFICEMRAAYVCVCGTDRTNWWWFIIISTRRCCDRCSCIISSYLVSCLCSFTQHKSMTIFLFLFFAHCVCHFMKYYW